MPFYAVAEIVHHPLSVQDDIRALDLWCEMDEEFAMHLESDVYLRHCYLKWFFVPAKRSTPLTPDGFAIHCSCFQIKGEFRNLSVRMIPAECGFDFEQS